MEVVDPTPSCYYMETVDFTHSDNQPNFMTIIDMEQQDQEVCNSVVQLNEEVISDSDFTNGKEIDEQSAKGHFGWCTVNKRYFPYIFRHGKKYCSAEMFENIFLNTFVSRIHPIVYLDCTKINSYKTTDAEEKLLNEINIIHCNYHFNKDAKGTQYEFLITLEDAMEFLEFLKIAFEVLYRPKYVSNKCGFLLVDSSFVSFVVINGEKYVPLLYFDGIQHYNIDSIVVKGWDMAYLKLCFTIQKLRKEFIEENELVCASFETIKSHLPPDTRIQAVWINEIVHCKHTSVQTRKKYMNWFHKPMPNI